MHMEIRGQLCGVSSLLPSIHGVQGWNSGCWVCVRSSLTSESSHYSHWLAICASFESCLFIYWQAAFWVFDVGSSFYTLYINSLPEVQLAETFFCFEGCRFTLSVVFVLFLLCRGFWNYNQVSLSVLGGYFLCYLILFRKFWPELSLWGVLSLFPWNVQHFALSYLIHFEYIFMEDGDMGLISLCR